MEITAGRRSRRECIDMRDVILKSEPVELHKILKFEGMVPSGGVAKLAIDSGDVMVNGEVETRKRKKIVAGDVIEFNGESIRMVLQQGD
jgi:ribosome-associated protein